MTILSEKTPAFLHKMSARLINLLFGVGKVFSVTPFYNQTVTRSQQIYAYIFVALNVVISIAGVFFRNEYKLHYAKTVVVFLMDLNLLTFTSYTCLSAVVLHKRHWQKLMKNLQVIISLVEDESKIRREVALSLFQLLVVLLVLILEYGFWVEIFSWEVFSRQYSFRYFQYFFFCTYNILLSFILCVVAIQYRKLSCKFGKMSRDSIVCLRKISPILEKIEHSLYLLKDTVALFNEIFGWPIAMVITHASLYMLNNLDFIFVTSQNREKQLELRMLADALLVMLTNVAGPFVVIIRCDLISKEVRALLSMSYVMQRFCKNLTEQERFEKFDKVVDRNFPQFSVAGFFFIDRSSILKILGCVTTFTIVMIQLRLTSLETPS